MRTQSFVRAAIAAALLGVTVPGTARAQSFWDLVHMAGQGGDLGSSESFSLGVGFGSIVAYASSGFDIWSKGFDASLPNDEKGLGLCDTGYHNGTYDCAHGSNNGSSYEIGDYPTNVGGWLSLDFSGLSVAVQSIVLASLSRNEDYAHYYTKTSGSCTSGSGWTDRGDVTDNNSDDLFTLSSASISGARCVAFSSDTWSNWSNDGDYLVQGVWTASPTSGTSELPSASAPEPASMTLLGTGLMGLAGMAKRRRKQAPKSE